MTSMQKPSEDHAQFDAICAEVGEWDALPTMVVPAAEPAPSPASEDDRDTELDGMILAGLVSPY
jgi:hypothetical protein